MKERKQLVSTSSEGDDLVTNSFLAGAASAPPSFNGVRGVPSPPLPPPPAPVQPVIKNPLVGRRHGTNRLLTYDPLTHSDKGENDALIDNTPIYDLLPARFYHARRVVGSSPVGGEISLNTPTGDAFGGHSGADGIYGNFEPFTTQGPSKQLWGEGDWVDAGGFKSGEGGNEIQLSKRSWTQPAVREENLIHEVGHAIWEKDLTPEEKAQWEKLHWDARAQWKVDRQQPGMRKLPSKWPGAVEAPAPDGTVYNEDPWHTFPVYWASYVQTPNALKLRDPKIYEYFKEISDGVEYINGERSGTVKDAIRKMIGDSLH